MLVAIVADSERDGILRVSDRGVGMTAETLVDHFMSAGATLQPSRVGGGLDQDRAGVARWMKAGRFGVGAFAAFLLGDEVRVTTRHIAAPRGLSCTLRMQDELVEVSWEAGLPAGTVIEVPFDLPVRAEHAPSTLWLLRAVADFYRLADPRVRYRHEGADGVIADVEPLGDLVPSPDRTGLGHWRRIGGTGLEAVLWTTPADESESPGADARVIHNGIGIYHPAVAHGLTEERWSAASSELRPPTVALFDGQGVIGLSLTRYGLSRATLPFDDLLLADVAKDIVAHSLSRHAAVAMYPLAGFLSWALKPVSGRHAWWPLWRGIGHDERLCVVWTRDARAPSRIGRALSLTQLGWDSPPLRAALPNPTHARTPDRIQGVARSNHALSRLVGRQPLVSAIAGPIHMLRRSSPGRDPVLRWEGTDHQYPKPVLIGTADDRAETVRMGADLAAALATLQDEHRPRVLTATIFEATPCEPDVIARTWAQHLGTRGIPYDDAERRALAQDVAAADADMAALIARWERHGRAAGDTD